MINKMKCMFSRLAAQFLKPTLALLATCVVGGAWAGYIDATGTVTHETLDASLATTEGIWIGNNDWLIWESSQTSDGFKTNGLVATYLELAGWDGASAKLQINSGFYRANTGDLTVGGKDAQAYFTLNGGRVETAYWMVTSTGAWNADTSSHVGNGGVSTIVVNDGELIIGYRYNDATQQYELSNNAVIDLARASSNKSYFLQRGGIVSSQGVENGNALVIANGSSSEAVYTISNGIYTARANTKIVLGNGAGSKGTLNIHGGTVNAATVSKGAGAGYVSFDGGTLTATAAGTLIGSGLTVTIGSNGGTIDVGANVVTNAAPVSGTGTITVKGTGSLTFTGDMSGFCGAVVVETSGCTVTLPASATKAVPGVNTSASNGVYSYSANTTHHDWWTGDSSTDWATAGNWGRFLIDEGTTGYDINEWNDNTINFASVVNISKPLTITETDPNNSYNVEFTASSASDGLVSTDVLNVGTSNEGTATFTSGTYSFNNMYVGGSGATGSVTVNGASLTITTGDPLIGNGGTGTFTLSSGFVSFGYAGSAKWAFLKGGTINLDGGEMAVCRLNCDTAPAVINFNGGTLTSYNDGYSKDNIIENDANWTLNVKAGGAKFNIPSGLTTTVNQVLAGDAESTGGGLTKLGGGALVLLAEPTFTGVITVFGGSVKLPAGATVAAGENTVKYESADGVYFYPKYTWCGSANDGAWTNPANWLVGEVAAVGYPSAEGEVAVIATAATIYSDVAISVSEIQTDAAVTFAGKLTSSSLVKSGTGTLTLVGVTSPTTDFAITAGSVVINNSLDGITPYVQLDASNESTVTVTGDYVTKWTSSVAENDTTHYYENADSTMTLTTDYFGGKRAVRTNGSNLKADFSNKLGVRSVFAVLYGISYPDGMRLYYKTGANNVYIGKRNSGNNYWSCLIASKTTPASPYLWQNGALDDLWSTTAAGSVFTVKKFMNNSTSADYLGGTGDIAIGELIGLSAAEPSASDSKRIEAYLGNKWKISGMQTFATSIPLTLSAGTTLDLGSLSRTVASLTGSGTVQNGKLNVTAAISVGAGETLVIPYGSTYTPAEGTVADVDETNGTVTFTKAPASITISGATTYYSTVQAAVDAAAANAEGEGKTVTLECNVTEDVSIPGIGITIVAGSYAITGTVTGASGVAVNYDEGTHTYTSVEASGWVWTGAYEGNNYWSDGRNWNYNGVAQEEGSIPGSSDTVTFESNASVTLTANQAVANVVLASDVVLTLSGNNAAFGLIGLVSLGSADVAGDKIVLNGVKLTSADLALNDGELNWYADLDVAGSPSTNFIYSTSSDGSNGRAIKIHGNLTGTGNIRLACNSGRSGTSFYGNNGGFSGVCIIDQDKGPRGPFTFCSADSGSASARWVYTGGANGHQEARVGAIGATNSTIHFGSYEGNIYIMGCRSVSGDTISIGGLNTDFRCSLSASSSAVADRANNNATLKKVGAGTMTFGNGAGNPCFNYYELNNGVLKFDNNGILRSATGQSSYAYPTFSFTGGTIAYGANCVDSGDNILDISGQLGESTAPLKVLLEAGQTSTWGTALTTVNAPQGLVKQGAGTLVLGAVPTYTAATVIEAGTLVVPGADVTIASLSISEGAQLAVDISQMADEASVTVTVTSGTALTADNFTFTGATGARTASIVIAEGGMSATLTATQANYVWTNNAVSDSNWSTLGNWNVGSAVATSLPTSGDVVEFPENAEVNVDIEGVAVQELILNGVATFSGNVIAIGTLTGDYEITLGNGGGFSIAANKTLANDFVITAATETPAVLTTSLNGVGFTLDGTLSGTGCLTLSGTSNTHQLHGDNSYFGGTINITGMSGQLVDHTSSVDYTSGTSADATWNVTFSGNNFLGNNVENDFPEYQFGKLTGTINESNAAFHHTVVYVVGGALPANETMALAYTGINNASRANSFRMVGEGTFEIDGSYVRSYEVNAGTVKFMSNTSIANYFIYFNGGTLALTSAVTSDPSEKFAFADGKTAILDDGGENRTFATAIGNDANGNATSANFTKKGTGTLTLSQPPAYTGTTKVEDGVLYVINGEYSLTPDSSTAEVTSDKDGYRKFVPAKKVIGLIFLAF